jgi:cyclin B
MRAILADWLVEVQENFELNHETLYLAVKLVDLYLSKKKVKKEALQLVGATAMFIASKFDVSIKCYFFPGFPRVLKSPEI